jgi:hypothetical protein
MGQAQKSLTCLATVGPETPVWGPETPVWAGDSGQSPDPSPEGASGCPGLESPAWTGGRSGDSGVGDRRLRSTPETPVCRAPTASSPGPASLVAWCGGVASYLRIHNVDA